ncbi:MAG: hypothetical protein K2H41_07260 [Acetatifactor sp.]|nr:hypothetical protein [Acetatifactor sp.]MDE6700341.1 hypothetical protein [Acetatifactor sp.]MDE7113289.1 hypothetical protein [Acetatifactor sp.]
MKKYTKKSLCWFLLITMAMLAGCGANTNKDVSTKLARIEIQNPNGTNVATLDKQSQSDVIDFFDDEEWNLCTDFDKTLTPKYIIELYQEKTPTVIKSGNSNDYEKILTYTVYEDSNVVMVRVSQDTAKVPLVSEETLTFYYIGSEDFFAALENVTGSF